MELVVGLVNCLVSFIIGALVTVALQYYIFMKYVKCEPVKEVPKKPATEKYCLPKKVLECLKSCDANDPAMPVAVNLLLQFLFHELRHSSRVRRWFWRKLDMELDELISKSTTGRLFDKLSLRDLHLGSQFPEIKNVQVQNVQLDETEGHIDTLDISLDLTYSGNFQLAIDANMVLGKRAYLAVKVRHVSGRARLRFTRLPYTHWSFSFYEEPSIDLAVESQFQGRQMQSNVTSFISNQIRRAIKRKHTLPNYKIRYKPFFTRTDPGQVEVDENANVEGLLEVTTLEISRLAVTNPNIEQIYYTMCIDSIPWISLHQKDDQVKLVLDVVITKTKTQQLGIVFKQESTDKTNSSVVIETIVPNSPAYEARLFRGDTIISIEGKPVSNTNQVAKIVKSVNMSSFNIRVERKLNETCVHNSTENITVQNFELPDQNTAKDLFNKDNVTLETTDASKAKAKQSSRSVENLTKISFYKSNDSVQIPLTSFGLRKRNCSVDKTSSDSSTGNTPTGSLATTPLRKQTAPSERTGGTNDYMNSSVDLKPVIRCFTSGDLPLKTVLPFNNVYTFEMFEGDVYLNVNVWGKNRACEGSVLLGYLNVPLATVINECRDSKLGHYLKCYSLLPPEFLQANSRTNPMSSHPGYEPCLCYGDILLSFLWSSSDQEKYQATSPPPRKQIFKSTQNYIPPEPASIPENDGSRRHDFIRTHFHRATQCDFCGKKIWLKDAVQCRECAMCCHKKCVIKCQASSTCANASSAQPVNVPTFRMTEQQFEDNIIQDEDIIQLKEPSISVSYEDSLAADASPSGDAKGYDFSTHRKSFSGLLQATLPSSMTIVQGVKRVNSANNLAIPGASKDTTGGSKSLPPSPQHTPRKQSLVSASSNPFDRCPALLEHCDVTDTESIAAVVEPLLQHPLQEDLMTLAKDTAKTLYVDMPGAERLDKIGAMVSKLRHALDSETAPGGAATRGALRSSAAAAAGASDAERAKQAFVQGKRDARVQALSALMLHYCAAMQHAQEQADTEKEQTRTESVSVADE